MSTALSRRGIMRASGGAVTLAALSAPASAATVQSPVRLHLNENPHGPSPRAKQAMQAALDDGWMYDNEDVALLRRTIAAKEGLRPENVFICEGSTEALRLAGLVFCGNGKAVVAGLPSFISMPQYAARSGGEVSWVNLDANMRLDLGAMESGITGNTGAVYICNPNNPTGTVVDAQKLRDFIQTVSPRALVVVDEAYIDLVDEPARMTMVEQVKLGRNVLIVRTFSKIHGIAGLRVGYALAKPDVIRKLEEMRISVPNRMGLKAALASYQDAEFLDYSRKMVRASVAYTAAFFDSLKVKYIPTQANFIMFDTGGSSVEFATTLREKFILVNPLFEPSDNWCRVSMGRMEHMEAFTAAARALLKKA